MNIGRTIMPRARSAWRAWLARNHASAAEIWLIFHKKSSGKQTLSLNDAIEEALCYGWIDGLVKSIDGGSYALRFTPRRKGSGWSASNLRRAERMIAEGKMTPAGLAALGRGGQDGEPTPRVYVTRLSPELRADAEAGQGSLGRLPPAPSVAPAHVRGVDHGCQATGDPRAAACASDERAAPGQAAGDEVAS